MGYSQTIESVVEAVAGDGAGKGVAQASPGRVHHVGW